MVRIIFMGFCCCRLSASSLAAPVGKRRFFPKPLSNRGNKTKSNKHSPRAAVANSAVANSAVARTRHSRSDAERTLDTARSVSAPPNVDPAMQAQNSHRSNGDTADQYQFVPSRIAQMSQTVSIKRINVSALAGLPIRGAGGSPPPSKDTDNSDSSVPPLPLTRPLSMTPPPSTPSTPSTPGGAGPSPTPSSPDWERASAQEIASLSTARSKRVSPLSAPHGNSRSRSTGNPFSGLVSFVLALPCFIRAAGKVATLHSILRVSQASGMGCHQWILDFHQFSSLGEVVWLFVMEGTQNM